MQKAARFLGRMLVGLFREGILKIGSFGKLDFSGRYFFLVVVVSSDSHPRQKINLTFCLTLIRVKFLNSHMACSISIVSIGSELF
jgi:hypothetical protein